MSLRTASTRELLLQWLIVGAGTIGLTVFAIGYATWVATHSAPVSLSCGEVVDRPSHSDIRFEVTGCSADLSDAAFEMRGLSVTAVYVPLRGTDSSAASPIVLRTTNSDVLAWARMREGERVEQDALTAWAGPRVFRAAHVGLVGSAGADISHREIAEGLRGESEDFVVLYEDGNLSGHWAAVGALGFCAIISAVGLVMMIRTARKRAAKDQAPKR
jgi:hypothetical protein